MEATENPLPPADSGESFWLFEIRGCSKESCSNVYTSGGREESFLRHLSVIECPFSDTIAFSFRESGFSSAELICVEGREAKPTS